MRRRFAEFGFVRANYRPVSPGRRIPKDAVLAELLDRSSIAMRFEQGNQCLFSDVDQGYRFEMKTIGTCFKTMGLKSHFPCSLRSSDWNYGQQPSFAQEFGCVANRCEGETRAFGDVQQRMLTVGEIQHPESSGDLRSSGVAAS